MKIDKKIKKSYIYELKKKSKVLNVDASSCFELEKLTFLVNG